MIGKAQGVAGLNLSVVIPCFNEGSRIGPTLKAVTSYFSGAGLTCAEIVVVDDGSRDDTMRKAEEFEKETPGVAVRIFRTSENRGKGAAVRRGFLSASGDVVLVTDADLSVPIEDLERLVREVDDGGDIAIGSRSMPGSRVLRKQTAARVVLGNIFGFMVRLFLLPGIRDTQCGFKLFRREAALAVFEELDARRFAYDIEVLARARRRGLSIREVPVVWVDSRPSRVRLFRDGSDMLLTLFRLFLHGWRGR